MSPTLKILILYFIVGIVSFILFEILSKDIRDNIKAKRKKGVLSFGVLYIVRPLLFFVIWPIPLTDSCGKIPFIRKRIVSRRTYKEMVSSMNEPPSRFKKNELTSEIMGGAGTIECKDCFYREEIISYLHGFGQDRWTNTGYQCQSCGKFCSIEYDYKLDQLPPCTCGGKLSRNEIIFCPKCRSTHLEYYLKYMT